MGRACQTEPPVPVEFIQKSFCVRDGCLVHRQSKRRDLVGEPAGFLVVDKPMVRLQVGGKTRRIAALRAAWVLAHGEYPNGSVQPCDGDLWNASPDNLTLVPNCAHRPWAKGGGQASSLQCRAEVDRSLLAAMAGHEGAGLKQLAKLVGIGEGRISTKLSKLAERGLAQSPMCVPGRSWMLTDQGRLAAAGRPLIDDLDRQVLAVLRSSPMGPVRLSRRLGTCLLTSKRRVGLLAERGLLIADVRKFYAITPAGIEALGPDAQPPPRWVNVAAISAAAAKDVRDRVHVDDSTAAQRSEWGRMARAAAKANGAVSFGKVFLEPIDRLRA